MVLTAATGSKERFDARRRRLAVATPNERAHEIAHAADAVRRRDLEMIAQAGMGHVGGDFSAADILAVLYMLVLRLDPERPEWPERDRFIQSKGHSSGALYAMLAATGFFDDSELDTYMSPLSPLNGHPDRRKIPGVETNTGPLGHGLPVGVGAAIAAALERSDRRVFVLVGDGELQEGSNWEAAMSAAHYGLDRLTVIVDRNGFQQGAATEDTAGLEPLADKWAAFGWSVHTVGGHDHEGLYRQLATTPQQPGKPTCLIANTEKGHGVSFMADRAAWHHKVPSAEETTRALEELTP